MNGPNLSPTTMTWPAPSGAGGRRQRARGRAARSRTAVALALVVAFLATLSQPRTEPARASTGPAVVSPVAWKSYPTNESVEMGDHSLNLNFNFGSPNNVVSSAAHNLRFGSRGTGSGYTVLLRTSSDGLTRKLPPTGAAVPRLGEVRVGLTPTSTLVEGSAAGLRLTAQVTKPYLPSEAADELASRITNGPFMYLHLEVENVSTSPQPAAAVYVGFGSSCGAPLDGFPRPGWQTLPLCNAGDAGGTRYLAVPKAAGFTSGTGSDTVADFRLDGALGGPRGGPDAAVALPVPALEPGAVHPLTMVYGAWNDAAGITAADGVRYRLYYRGWWEGPAQMLSFGIDHLDQGFDAATAFDRRVEAVSSNPDARYGAAHAFRGWRHANWLVRKPDDRPLFAVTEGAFNYLSTVDVGYEYHPFQTRYEPWKSSLELDQWRDRYELDGAGNKFLLHDIGVDNRITPGPAYDRKDGVRRHMPVEHNLDMVAMIFAWEDRTGQRYDKTLVRELLDAAESHDRNQDGSIDVAVMRACLPSTGACRTSQLGTTYDGAVSVASKVQAGNTILTTKMGVVESFAAVRGHTPRSGDSYTVRARRHLERSRALSNRLSSDSSLEGHDRAPGYLADALLYATVLNDHNPVLELALSTWLNQALVDNQAAALGDQPSTAIVPNARGETIVWISKALDGDAVGAWVRRQWPSWTTLLPQAPKLWRAWNRRSSGTGEGTFDFAAYPTNDYRSAGWYPRSVSLWAAAPGFPSQRPSGEPVR